MTRTAKARMKPTVGQSERDQRPADRDGERDAAEQIEPELS